jgi:hypothetical protein
MRADLAVDTAFSWLASRAVPRFHRARPTLHHEASRMPRPAWWEARAQISSRQLGLLLSG